MRNKLIRTSTSKKEALRNIINKEVKVVSGGEWSGVVIGVVDEENLLVLKKGKEVRVNIFDIRSK